uniref:Secreted protein n=1 Tax=Rhipicephalus microplus TaxID=6941 RepID=A0A6M2D9E7_RHIMP
MFCFFFFFFCSLSSRRACRGACVHFVDCGYWLRGSFWLMVATCSVIYNIYAYLFSYAASQMYFNMNSLFYHSVCTLLNFLAIFFLNYQQRYHERLI